MFGNVILGRTDSKMPFFTEYGSFWSNGTTELLATTTGEDRQARTRNRCNGEGYESVALIPLRSSNRSFGLIQINAKQKALFSRSAIAVLEAASQQLSLALSKQIAIAQARQRTQHLETVFDAVAEPLIVVERTATQLKVILEDDGIGIDETASAGGLGLVSMHQRVAIQKGTIEIESIPNHGTTIFATIPIGDELDG